MRSMLGGLLALTVVTAAPLQGADVAGLTAKLKSGDNEVRRTAAKELGELGAGAAPAVPALTRALADRDTYVRRFAAESLGAIGPEAQSAAPALGKALNDSRKEVQLAAVAALAKLGPVSVKALTSAVKDPSKDGVVRSKAAQGLANLGPEAHASLPVLTSLLTGKVKGKGKGKNKQANDDDVRVDVAVAMGAVATKDDTAAIAALKSVSEGKQKNKALKKAAAEALEKITGEPQPKKKKKKKQA
jgi:HEAT repeat protein